MLNQTNYPPAVVHLARTFFPHLLPAHACELVVERLIAHGLAYKT